MEKNKQINRNHSKEIAECMKYLNMEDKTARGNMDFFTTNDIINKIAGQTETERGRTFICSINIVLLLNLMSKKSNFLLEERIL